MGHCYQQEQLGLLDAAIRCHRRALPYDKEGVAVHKLMGAALCMLRCSAPCAQLLVLLWRQLCRQQHS